MNPTFSVVITVFNKEKYISETISSVLNQTFQDFEVIIVNDGSSDHSLTIINEYKDKCIQVVTQENQGASNARNKGISEAKGKFIALLDGDDLWKPEYLQTIHKAIGSHPEQHVFTCAIAHQYDKAVSPVPYSFQLGKESQAMDYFEASQKHSILSGSSIVFNRNILEQTGLFDTDLRSGEDTDFWIRVGLHQKIVFIPNIMVFYTYDSRSLSNTSFKASDKPKFDSYSAEESKNKYLKKFLDRNRFSIAILSKLDKDNSSFEYYRNSLEPSNLSFKQRIALISPRWLLKLFLKIKSLGGKKLYYEAI